MLESLADGAGLLVAPGTLLAIVVGSALGLLLGVLPGIGGLQGLALALPLTFTMDPVTALVFLGSIYGAGVYSGAITSILINTPGDPTSAATIFDGYPMARRGEAGVAIGGATMASLIGALSGILLLAVGGPPLAQLAVRLGSPDYFAAAILGLAVVAVTVQGSALKGFVSGVIGLLFSLVGFSQVLGFPRYTFGTQYLQDGLPFVAITVGLFGLSEAFFLLGRGGSIATKGALGGGVLQGMVRALRHPVTLARSTVIGMVIGLLPGMGATAANFIAYGEAQRTSKTPEKFGTGHLPGVLAPEASNNAVMGAALIPTLTLGIPGSAGTALLLGGAIMHGLRPGRALFEEGAPTLYAFILGLALSSLVFAVGGMLLAGPLSRVTLVPVEILSPLIIVFAVIAAYATRERFGDVVVACAAGLVGYVMRRCGYSLVPLLIGFVLGPIVENSFHQTMIISDGSYLIFLQRPVTLLLLSLSVLIVVARARQSRRLRRRERQPAASRGESGPGDLAAPD